VIWISDAINKIAIRVYTLRVFVNLPVLKFHVLHALTNHYGYDYGRSLVGDLDHRSMNGERITTVTRQNKQCTADDVLIRQLRVRSVADKQVDSSLLLLPW